MSRSRNPANAMWPVGLSLRTELKPGDLGRMIALHGEVYDACTGFGLPFEAFVAQTMAEFGLHDRFNGRLWLLERDQTLLGCCAIVYRQSQTAQLRWVLLAPELRGLGLGRRLLELSIDHCRDQGYRQIVLDTTDGLEASGRLYEQLGFRIISDSPEILWDGPRPLIRMQKDLGPAQQ